MNVYLPFSAIGNIHKIIGVIQFTYFLHRNLILWVCQEDYWIEPNAEATDSAGSVAYASGSFLRYERILTP